MTIDIIRMYLSLCAGGFSDSTGWSIFAGTFERVNLHTDS